MVKRNFEKKDCWIPCLIKKPKKSDYYLVFRKFGNGSAKLDICFFKNGYFYGDNGRILYSVTHWKKAPKEPSGEYQFTEY